LWMMCIQETANLGKHGQVIRLVCEGGRNRHSQLTILVFLAALASRKASITIEPLCVI
jgi:hypothetical protein